MGRAIAITRGARALDHCDRWLGNFTERVRGRISAELKCHAGGELHNHCDRDQWNRSTIGNLYYQCRIAYGNGDCDAQMDLDSFASDRGVACVWPIVGRRSPSRA